MLIILVMTSAKTFSQIRKVIKITVDKGNLHLTRPKSGEIDGEITKYYINNPPNLMKSQNTSVV